MNRDDGKKRKFGLITRVTATVLLALGLAACASVTASRMAKNVTIDVKIEPDPDNNDALCPMDVDKPNPDVFRDKKVTWQAVDVNGANLDYKFEIYFDPIQGRTLNSNANGKLEIPVDRDAPTVEYKYTIWDRVQGNEPHQCDPLDPHFKVF